MGGRSIKGWLCLLMSPDFMPHVFLFFYEQEFLLAVLDFLKFHFEREERTQ